MGRQVFGHSSRYTEEKGVPAIRIGGIRPGGVVDVITPVKPDPALVAMPMKIHAFYVPAGDPGRGFESVYTPESLEASGFPHGSEPVPPDGGNVTIRVAGIKPGQYDVQLVLEYPDDGSGFPHGESPAAG
jgi:hypothetical protein